MSESFTVSEYFMDRCIYNKSFYLLRELSMVCGQKTEWEQNSWRDIHIFVTEKEKNKRKGLLQNFSYRNNLFPPSTQCYISDPIVE